jgi:hypothetical protein
LTGKLLSIKDLLISGLIPAVNSRVISSKFLASFPICIAFNRALFLTRMKKLKPK